MWGQPPRLSGGPGVSGRSCGHRASFSLKSAPKECREGAQGRGVQGKGVQETGPEHDPSREAAKECSPRRKPWDSFGRETASPEGAKETNVETNVARESFVFLTTTLVATHPSAVCTHSIPNVPRVVLDMIPLQKRHKLFLKRSLLVTPCGVAIE